MIGAPRDSTDVTRSLMDMAHGLGNLRDPYESLRCGTFRAISFCVNKVVTVQTKSLGHIDHFRIPGYYSISIDTPPPTSFIWGCRTCQTSAESTSTTVERLLLDVSTAVILLDRPLGFNSVEYRDCAIRIASLRVIVNTPQSYATAGVQGLSRV